MRSVRSGSAETIPRFVSPDHKNPSRTPRRGLVHAKALRLDGEACPAVFYTSEHQQSLPVGEDRNAKDNEEEKEMRRRERERRQREKIEKRKEKTEEMLEKAAEEDLPPNSTNEEDKDTDTKDDN